MTWLLVGGGLLAFALFSRPAGSAAGAEGGLPPGCLPARDADLEGDGTVSITEMWATKKRARKAKRAERRHRIGRALRPGGGKYLKAAAGVAALVATSGAAVAPAASLLGSAAGDFASDARGRGGDSARRGTCAR